MAHDVAGPGPMVQGFARGGFRVDGVVFAAALMTTAAASAWMPPPLAALTIDDLAALTATSPEFILLGTGATLVRPPAALVQALAAANIGLEPMDSRAAARAWAVLRNEGRSIAVALYPLD